MSTDPRLEEFKAALTAVGLPDDATVAHLIQHHRANAGLAAESDQLAAELSKESADEAVAQVKLLEAAQVIILTAADTLADAVDEHVRQGLLGSRTPPADSLLDYQDMRAQIARL